MGFARASVIAIAALAALPLVLSHVASFPDTTWYKTEVAFLAGLKSRVTGSPNHNSLIDHIQSELEILGLHVFTNTLDFTYLDQPLSPPSLTVGGQVVDISSFAPYSGKTSRSGISGNLVDLTGLDDGDPDWSRASGNIAVLNASIPFLKKPITNSPWNVSETFALWPGQPPWYVQTGLPVLAADARVANLTRAAELGIKGVIYVWEHITAGNARGQYAPFKRLYQGIPTVFVAGDAAKTVLLATKAKERVHLTLRGELVQNTPTRTIWAVVEGTKFKTESIIINTHTDGVNAVEENGHIALLAKARDLIANPPERTTILLFVTGHMHQPAFSTKGRATTRWLDDNPQYWKGGPGRMKAVASVCVEHLGAVNWVENLTTGRYYSAGNQTDELIYANTPELVNLLEKFWDGAYPDFIRVNNPIPKGAQVGEGEPLTVARIPNLSLITTPLYLLAEWPEGFDERELVDVEVMKLQVESFMRIWKVMDTMSAESFGKVPSMEGAETKVLWQVQ